MPSGRSPRQLALLAPGLLLVALLVLEPGVRPASAPTPAVPDIRLLESRSGWADRAALADPAPLVLPELGPAPALPDSAQPDATPFAVFPALLRSAPASGLTARLDHTVSPWALADPRQLPESEYPLRTLGQRPPVAPPPAIGPNVRLVSLSGGEAIPHWPIESSEELHKQLQSNSLSINYPLVFSLGIDAYGLQARPVMESLSGLDGLDRAAARWVESQPWAARLRPGSYRLEIRP